MIKKIFFATIMSIIGTTFLNAENVSFWNLNDSVTATSAADSISGLNATKNGNVIFESVGALTSTGTSASFDGSSTLEVPYTTALNPNGSFSIDAWVRPTSGTGTRSFVSSRAADKSGFIVRIDSNNKFRFYVGDGEWRYLEGPTATLNVWTHVLATFESRSLSDGVHTGVAKIFVNGKLAQFKTLTYRPNTSNVRPFRIGGGGDVDAGTASVYNFTGDIDEVSLANHVVQPADLASYFDNTNGLTREIFYDIPSHGVHLITGSSKYPWYPDVIDYITDFDTGTSTGDNYGARVRGYITVPEDGSYKFFLASDDRGDLRISLDGSEEGLQSIATVSGWTGHKVWDKYETQTSEAFELTAGQKIYTEAFFKEGGGGDHLAVAWSKNDGAIELITNEYLTPFIYDLAEQRLLLESAIGAAQDLYDLSAQNIGTNLGQYSESSRMNFNIDIALAQNVYDTEDVHGRNLALAIRALETAVFNFNGGVKPTKILGTPFGTDPAWAPDRTFLAAHDGNPSTFFDYLIKNGGYTGIEVPDGRETAVLALRYHPRSTLFSRMVGGKFQGSLDGVTYTTLHTITEEPIFQWYEVEVSDATPYKFLRYLSPNNSNGNIAELEFLGYQNQELFMLHHEIISVKADTADQALPELSLKAEHGGLLPQFITYKVLSIPANGTIKLNGVELEIDGTFTQEDINNNLLTYSANDSRLDDSFSVEVKSSVGGLLPEVIVDLKIDSDLDGLSDQQEIALGTDFNNADTNGNGISDSWEVENGLDPIDTETLPNLVTSIEGENGLSASYNYGRFNQISDFANRSPAKVTKVANINFSNSYWAEFANSGAVHNVGAKFSGYLYVPIEGNYKFILSSDDGSKLFINGAQVITNDGLHSYTQVSAVVNLSAGFHPIRCEYFEAGGHHGCILQWEGPSRARQIIPNSFFFLSLPEHETLIDSADSDQDFLTDKLELIEGSDPNNPDSDGDKLLDGEEFHSVYGFKTNTDNIDTDSDTVSDYDEIFIYNSNPLVPDFNGESSDKIVIIPSQTSNRKGLWTNQADQIFANDRRGELEYDVRVLKSGFYRLDLEIDEKNDNKDESEFDIHLHVNNEFVTRQVNKVYSSPTKISFLTTYLMPGDHKIKLTWDNVYYNTSLHIKTIELTKPNGPDNDGNGLEDWLDNYLINNYSLFEYSSTSKVSPAQIEGKGKYINSMDVSYGAEIKRSTANNWYAEFPLARNSIPTPFIVSLEHKLKEIEGSITWEETNILDELDMTIKAGSSLLLNAVIDGDTDSNTKITITTGEVTEIFNSSPENPVEYKFTIEGTYTIKAEYEGSISSVAIMNLKVISAPNIESPFMWRGKERFWNWDDLDDFVTLDATGMEFSKVSDGYLMKRSEILEDVHIIARIGVNGPIIDSIPTKAFWLRDVVEGYVGVLETFDDGSLITRNTLFGVNLPEEVEIKINTISGVTFLDGASERILTSQDFDELGQYELKLLKSEDRNGANCHWYKVYQNGILVGQQNK